MRHPHVMWLGGQLVDDFVVADHRDQARRGIGEHQRSVVEPRAAAQPDSGAVDRQRGTKTTAAAATASAGSHGPAGSRRPNRASTRPPGRYAPPLQRHGDACGVVTRYGQQNPHVHPQQRIDQLDRTGLGADGHIGADRVAVPK